jgi:hypothetical protein
MKCTILDGANLQTRRYANQRYASDGTVYTQSFDTAGKGRAFGVRFDFLAMSLFGPIIAAVTAAIDANGTFNVTLADDFQSVNTDCIAHFSLNGNWLSYPDQRTNTVTIRNVVMRFLTA